MATLRPFQGIRYDPQRVDLAKVVAPPYDIITPADQVRYYREDPRNVVRLIAGQVSAADTPQDNKYTRAAAFFREWLATGILRREPGRCLYIYRHRFRDAVSGENRVRVGVMGVVGLEPFGSGILAHERTHARAKADRLSLTRAVDANLSPVFGLYEDPDAALAPVIELETRAAPGLSIEVDGETHEVWCIAEAAHLREVQRVLAGSRVFIADGHHRYLTALTYRDRQRSEYPEAPPDAAFNFVLMMLVDINDAGLAILPTHRLLRDLEQFDGRALVHRLSQTATVVGRPDRAELLAAMQEPAGRHRVGIALPDSLATADLPEPAVDDPVARLDVSRLHHDVLEKQLGLDPAVLEQERYLSYSRDVDYVLDEVQGGRAQAAFLLRPPAVSDVLAVAQAGEVMPQKSTYFFPKPLSGIVFNPLDPAIRIPAA